MDAKKLLELAQELFTKKSSLNSLHQEVAEHFYPERADYTITRSWGTDFAANLMSSYPVQCRRELGNQFATMLRPTARPWFHPRQRYKQKSSSDVRGYLEWFEETQRRAMYYRPAMFTRATKEGDHDYAAIGQCAISVELNRDANGLLYRCWHIRDMAWQEDEEGALGMVARKWKPTASTLKALFKDKVDPKITEKADKAPFEEIDVMHMVVKAEMYDDKAGGRPRWSIYYDVTHSKLIEATPIWGRHYVIPRWQTVSGSQYSYSPATVCALPDARLLQAMTFTLLEAGEKATSPPLIATQDAVRSDISTYAGGITWVDQEYDEKLGEALRPLTQDFRGFNFGVELNQDTRAMLHKAFFLDALTLPSNNPEMTAYEVGQRVQEYIRAALPIFEPTEMEYNGALCEETFTILWRNGAFGPVENWPKELRQQDGMRWGASEDVSFEFESPLHDIIEQQKGQKFQEAVQLVGSAIALDPACQYLPKATVALRDALQGIGIPASWVNSEGYVDQAKQQAEAQAQSQQRLAAIEQASNAVKNIGMSGMAPATAAPAQ
jgi:hypothetical protein